LVDIESAYSRYFPLVREKCRRMLRNSAEADDIAQETFVRLWRSRLTDEGPRTVISWLYRTSTRLAIDLLRSQKRHDADDQDVGAEEIAALMPSSEDKLVVSGALDTVARKLPADELEIAFLHRLDGLTQAEIAEVVRVSERTVRRCLQRLDERVEALRKEKAG
jgi:RNA polymerase sigma-70 factor, ECF subfamily